jgi:RNA polymerase sigma factor (sigma-70 family)
MEQHQPSARDIERVFLDVAYRECRQSLYQLLLRQTKDAEASEDLTQEAFIILSRRAHRHNMLCPPWPYLNRISENLLKKWKKNRCVREPVLLPEYADTVIPDNRIDFTTPIENRELGNRIYSIIDSLPEKLSQVARMRQQAGTEYGEIASRLGISLRSAKRYMQDARGRIRRILEKEYPAGTLPAGQEEKNPPHEP